MPAGGKVPSLEHFMCVGVSDCLLPVRRILEHLEALGAWWQKLALPIWEAGSRKHDQNMTGIFCLVAKCWGLQRLLWKEWGGPGAIP